MTIQNKFDVDDFDGEKWFVLSTANGFGGHNPRFAIAFIVIGCISIVWAIIFALLWKYKKTPELRPPSNH